MSVEIHGRNCPRQEAIEARAASLGLRSTRHGDDTPLSFRGRALRGLSGWTDPVVVANGTAIGDFLALPDHHLQQIIGGR